MQNPISILTPAEMAALDARAIDAGLALDALIARAGAAVARVICDRFSPRPVIVWAGPGNNGADGYVTATLLKAQGWPVRIEAFAPPASAGARAAAAGFGDKAGRLNPVMQPGMLYVDALFGTGLQRDLNGAAAALARASAERPSPILAIDLPSGLCGLTGQPLGPESMHADLTVTFHARKCGHVLYPARGQCGRIEVADIGLEPLETGLHVNGPDLFAAAMPWPKITDHKHARGELYVVSGGPSQTGAARLALRAGLRAGAGVATLLSPPDAMAVNAAHLEAAMLRAVVSAPDYAIETEDADAVVIGPAAGVGEATCEALLALARTGAALVVDADALTSFRHDPEALFAVLDRDDVLTPHPGEFKRLFPGLLEQSAGRIEAARAAARQAGSVVLLKGADTVIAAEDGRTAVNLNGSPWLATAGSGDVLAGLIAGLIAQGMDSFLAACAGAWIHAEAGAAFGPGLIAEDLPDLIPPVLRRLWLAREAFPFI